MRNKILFAISCVFTISCSSSSTINPGPSPTVLPITDKPDLARHKELMDDAMTQAPQAGIAGIVMTSDRISIPVPRVLIGLFKLDNGDWTEITRFTTETDGKFSITRKLSAGSYEVRSLDKRYKGKVTVTLTSQPVTNLVLTVEK